MIPHYPSTAELRTLRRNTARTHSDWNAFYPNAGAFGDELRDGIGCHTARNPATGETDAYAVSAQGAWARRAAGTLRAHAWRRLATHVEAR